MQQKLRVIRPSQPQRGYKEVLGITIPHDIAVFFKDVFFSVEKDGTSIILTSGCKLNFTEKQITTYKFEDCKI